MYIDVHVYLFIMGNSQYKEKKKVGGEQNEFGKV